MNPVQDAKPVTNAAKAKPNSEAEQGAHISRPGPLTRFAAWSIVGPTVLIVFFLSVPCIVVSLLDETGFADTMRDWAVRITKAWRQMAGIPRG